MDFAQDDIVFGSHGNVGIRKLSASSCQEIIKKMHFLESFRVNPSIAGRPEILHLSNPWKTLLIEYSVSPSKTDANGFVFEPIAMDSINNKLMNGDRNTSGDNDEVNLNLAKKKSKDTHCYL